eukprot:59865-Pyramimonas_sp.AAC.1
MGREVYTDLVAAPDSSKELRTSTSANIFLTKMLTHEDAKTPKPEMDYVAPLWARTFALNGSRCRGR